MILSLVKLFNYWVGAPSSYMREISKSGYERVVKRTMQQVMRKIGQAALEGRTSVELNILMEYHDPGLLCGRIKTLLEKEGYVVTIRENCGQGFLLVSW